MELLKFSKPYPLFQLLDLPTHQMSSLLNHMMSLLAHLIFSNFHWIHHPVPTRIVHLRQHRSYHQWETVIWSSALRLLGSLIRQDYLLEPPLYPVGFGWSNMLGNFCPTPESCSGIKGGRITIRYVFGWGEDNNFKAMWTLISCI